MTSFELASVAGLVLGPIAAAMIAFKLQDRAMVRQRRLDVFRTLMRTRRTPLNPDHVGALNLVEIDFAGHRTVLEAHKRLFDSFSRQSPRSDGETHNPTDDDGERQRKDSVYGTRLFEERQHLLAKLLFSMGRVLAYRIEQLDILEGGYHPSYHAEIELQQGLMRNYLVKLASGEQSLPVRVIES